MNYTKSRWRAVALGLAIIVSLIEAQADEKPADNQKPIPPKKLKSGAKAPAGGVRTPGTGSQYPNSGPGNPGGQPRSVSPVNPPNEPNQKIPVAPSGPGPTPPPPTLNKIQDSRPARSASGPTVAPLTTVRGPDGRIEKKAPSGKVREVTSSRPTGEQQTKLISPTGRTEREVIKSPDGTVKSTQLDLGNRPKKIEVVRPNGIRETTDIHYNRNGEERAKETVKVNAQGRPISKTVEVKNNLVIRNTTVNHTTIINNRTTIVNNTRVVREYVPCRYGYAYTPALFVAPLYVGFYDPFWYAPVVIGGPVVAIRTHSFTFSWGWSADPWYRYHRAYWAPYPVYVAPSYWVTDWMVADYLADRYAVVDSAQQMHEEVRLAREDADKARQAAERAQDQAEIAEARAAQSAAEARAARAEARAEKAEVDEAKQKEIAAGQTNPNATPIDENTKNALREQIETTIAQQAAKGTNLVANDVLQALNDPKHIFPVSKNSSVVLAKDSSPAGTLTAGDLLKVEPGQEAALKDASENTFITMRVMTSKGEEEEVKAGTLVSIPLKDLQEFDNEFRAKLDQGLQEADKNKDQFKQMAKSQ